MKKKTKKTVVTFKGILLCFVNWLLSGPAICFKSAYKYNCGLPPSGSGVKYPPVMQETQKWVLSLGWEDPLEEAWQPTAVFLPGKAHGLGKPWWAAVHRVPKSQTRLR